MHTKDYLRPLEDLLRRDKAFGHRQHVELAWRYLNLTNQMTAETWMREAIKHVAIKHGAPDKYHETRTIAWIRLIGVHTRKSNASNFDDFVAENPDLLNVQLLDHFYTTGVLQDASARMQWVEPDLSPLP